mmetsp:Transcript_89759/g.287788  ORF Transcript_89759/g.287788 Transcript_89759/m.287788 type:complete len:89 (+) Transcript_89759:3-269(+)
MSSDSDIAADPSSPPPVLDDNVAGASIGSVNGRKRGRRILQSPAAGGRIVAVVIGFRKKPTSCSVTERIFEQTCFFCFLTPRTKIFWA